MSTSSKDSSRNLPPGRLSTPIGPGGVDRRAVPDRITRVIFEHAIRIGRAKELAEIIRLNADFARDLVGADRCSLWLLDEATDELWTMVAHGVNEIRIPKDKGLVGACVAEGGIVVANDLSNDPRFLRKVDKDSGYHTEQVLCVAMHADDRIIGALQLLNKPGGFTETDTGLLTLVAHFAANAITSERLREEAESAKVLRHEVDLARDVQFRLLPQGVNGVPGVECASFCRPAKDVGGDYYDLLPLRSGEFAFTLGDVSGKNIPAAVMMASIQTLLRNLLQRDGLNLSDTICELNRDLYASSTAERYSTLFCGVMNAERTLIRYVNAGQVQPLLLRANGELEQLQYGGMPVGMLPVNSYTEMSVEVGRGDLIVVISDGVTEARNEAGEFWDEEIVARTIREHGSAPVSALPEKLCAKVDEFAAGAEQYDDITVVAVRIQ